MRIYLDMCCYNRPYDDQSQLKVFLETQSKLHIQTLIKDKKLKLVTSYMLRYECSNNPFEMRRNAIFDFINRNTYAYIGDERKLLIEEKAAEIMKTGVKFKDACHVASAIYTARRINLQPCIITKDRQPCFCNMRIVNSGGLEYMQNVNTSYLRTYGC